MPDFDRNFILNLLCNGSPEERVKFIMELPPTGFNDSNMQLFSSEHPGIVIIALAPLIQKYAFGANPKIGALLADAAHERARELFESMPDHGLLPTTLSALADNHLRAMSLLGQSEQLVTYAAKYEQLYDDEKENICSIIVLKAEALINLNRIDEAYNALRREGLQDDPVNGMKTKRLLKKIAEIRGNAGETDKKKNNNPETSASPDVFEYLNKAIDKTFEGDQKMKIKEKIKSLKNLGTSDTSKPDEYKHLLETLNNVEGIFQGKDDDSELALRSKIRNASAIFVHGTPEKDIILRSLVELTQAYKIAEENNFTEHISDSLYGIYLCNSRLFKSSEAADALILLRKNLEKARNGIKDPLKRAGVFKAYPYLFGALCEHLYKSDRYSDLLEAIESSKGRVIADRLTEDKGEVLEDASIYACVSRLPQTLSKLNCHYLTYFVDDECVYAVIVTKTGQILAPDPMNISKAQLQQAAMIVDPDKWGKPKKGNPKYKNEKVSTSFSPLVAFLEKMLNDGILNEGDHICYSADEDINSIPLHYLDFLDGILLDYFSISKVHSAFQIDYLLQSGTKAKIEKLYGIIVPFNDESKGDKSESFLASLFEPIKFLSENVSEQTILNGKKATPEQFLSEEILLHSIIHFSTHGWFPVSGQSPYNHSYLLLSDGKQLPFKDEIIAQDSPDWNGILTPGKIVESGINLKGSHISLMACISGLAKEGIGGDALGLDWAFLQAGAASLISTHWHISAAAAEKFFTAFYKKWLIDGQIKASAYRETILELIKDNRSPEELHKWTAFTLTGDFR